MVWGTARLDLAADFVPKNLGRDSGRIPHPVAFQMEEKVLGGSHCQAIRVGQRHNQGSARWLPGQLARDGAHRSRRL